MKERHKIKSKDLQSFNAPIYISHPKERERRVKVAVLIIIPKNYS